MDTAIKKWKLLPLFVLFLSACSLGGQAGKGALSSGLIITPASYYSTQKARILGERYRQHLERLVQELVDDPVTGKLQFANNIASVGGIGFFTHSATGSPDERYLEVVLGVPEVFDAAVDLNSKVNRLFSLYGTELLSILASDEDIYRDKDVAGYGLNLSWRTTSEVSGRRRVTLERTVIYISKQETRRFLEQRDSQALLEASVIYFIGTDGLPRRFAYSQPGTAAGQPVAVSKEGIAENRARFSKVELEPEIREQNLAARKQAEEPPKQAVLEKTPESKRAEEAGRIKEETAEKASAEKTVAREKSIRERREEIAKKAPDLPKGSMKLPSPAVEVTKRAGPPESEAGPELMLKEKTPEQPEESKQKVKAKAGAQKAAPEPESTEERPEEIAKDGPGLSKEATEAPSVPVEIAKPTAPPENKVERELPLEKETAQQPATLEEETTDKGRKEKPALNVESGAEQRKEVVEGVPESSKEVVKEPSREIKVARRTVPAEKKAEPELVRQEETPGQGDRKKKERAAAEKPQTRPEGEPDSRKERVKPIPDAQEEAVTEPAPPPVEIAKRTVPPEEKAPAELEIKEEIPEAVEEKLPQPQPLEGYLVQFVFSERAKAEQWSRLLSQEGYATTMNTIRGNKAVRLRVGPFASATEAGRLLEKRQRQGLTGMVVFHVSESRSSLAMKRVAKEPGMVLSEKTVVERTRASEEAQTEQPKTSEAIVPRAGQKEVPGVKPPQPKMDVKLPEKKEEVKDKTAPEVVLKKKIPEVVEGEKQPAGELPKIQTIHGYLVQVSFLDAGKAKRWSELLSRKGYSTSMSRIRGKESVRLRIGAFPSSVEAQVLLKKLQKEGLTGFIVQAPR